MSGSSQWFTFLYDLLEKKYAMLPSNLQSVFLQHPSKFESKFSSVPSGEFIKLPSFYPSDPIVLCWTRKRARSVISPEKEGLFRKSDKILDFIAWRTPNLGEKTKRMVIPFVASYLCEAGFSAMAVIKTKCRSRISLQSEIRMAVSKILPRFD